MNWSIRYQVSDSYSLLQSLGVSAVIKAGKLFSIEEMQFNAVVGPNRNLKISKSPLKSQAQGTSLFTSAASNKRGYPEDSPWDPVTRGYMGAE